MRILDLDIETAPNNAYVWGLWGQNIGINQIVEPGYTLCYTARFHDSKVIHAGNIYDISVDQMLRDIHSLLDEADAVVHYNGTKFDIPTINREFLKYGIAPPSPYAQIDLLKTVKKHFKFASNKLDFVCQQLGLGAKTQHKGMDLWKGCMLGNPRDWKVMMRYNRQDVMLLRKLYNKLLPWIDNHPIVPLYSPVTEIEEMQCPNCGSTHVQRRGFAYTKTRKYARFVCNGCGKWSRNRVMLPTDQQPILV